MRKRPVTHEENDRAAKRNTRSNKKKPYRSPRLTVYGDLIHLTGGQGGKGGDGGTGNQTRI